MTKGDLAKNYFESGLNCSTAVVMAFKDEMGLSEEQLKKLVIGLGGGFARKRLICGAVSGMNIVLSYLLSDGNDKGYIYSLIQNALDDFTKEVGSIICGDLLSGKVQVDTNPNPESRTNEYYKKRPCSEICLLSANIVEKYIEKYKNKG